MKKQVSAKSRKKISSWALQFTAIPLVAPSCLAQPVDLSSSLSSTSVIQNQVAAARRKIDSGDMQGAFRILKDSQTTAESVLRNDKRALLTYQLNLAAVAAKAGNTAAANQAINTAFDLGKSLPMDSSRLSNVIFEKGTSSPQAIARLKARYSTKLNNLWDFESPILDKYVINVGKDGLLSADSAYQVKSDPESLDSIFKRMDQVHTGWITSGKANKRHIFIYAHGGLTSDRGAIENAESHIPWCLANHIYPIYFVWHTDLADSLHARIHR